MSEFTSREWIRFPREVYLDASLDHSADTVVRMVGHATVGNNGIYIKRRLVGRLLSSNADLLYGFIVASEGVRGKPGGRPGDNDNSRVEFYLVPLHIMSRTPDLVPPVE